MENFDGGAPVGSGQHGPRKFWGGLPDGGWRVYIVPLIALLLNVALIVVDRVRTGGQEAFMCYGGEGRGTSNVRRAVDWPANRGGPVTSRRKSCQSLKARRGKPRSRVWVPPFCLFCPSNPSSKTLSIYGLYEDRHLELFQRFAAEGCFQQSTAFSLIKDGA